MDVKRLILRTFQSPGDVVLLTGAVRDLHLANPGRFETDVRTSAPAIWEHNPRLTPLGEGDSGVEVLEMHYPLIHESNQRPLHFIHGYPQYLEQVLAVKVPVTAFRGDIHLTAEEMQELPWLNGEPLSPGAPFWIVVAGGKYDFTAKWWNPERFQQVVDHFAGRIQFVQCGEQGHWHPRLNRVIDLVGKTTLREFIRLVYHADGVLCPVTLAMHLAAAVPARPGGPPRRACVVVAGGREPAHWEAYPNHQFISTTGSLPCCSSGGCWKSRCQLVGDGDQKDRTDVCERPVQLTAELRIPSCMQMISAADVIRRIEMYYEGGALRYAARTQATDETAKLNGAPPTALGRSAVEPAGQTQTGQRVLIEFRHGLGDSVQLTSLLAHLKHYHPDWAIDVAALVGKQSIYTGQCNSVQVLDRDTIDQDAYQSVYNLDWPECHTCYQEWPSTKAERCLREVFNLLPIPALCRYRIDIGQTARQAARQYLAGISGSDRAGGSGEKFPTVLIHYQGNTSGDTKDLSHDLVRQVCADLLSAAYVPVILDWDNRSPLADGRRIHNPGASHELWKGVGTGDAEVMAALIAASALVIGVDSGPLHAAGATATPTIGVWTGHHPLHYFGHADNVLHLVPQQHAGLLRADPAAGSEYFASHYRHETYTNLEQSLRKLVWRHLPADSDGLVRSGGFWIRRDNALQDLVIVKDIAEQDSYRIAEFSLTSAGADLSGPLVIDVGAHIGVFSRALVARWPDARVITVECCPENIPALKRNVGPFAQVVQAALTYQADVALLNAVYPDCVSTGGSTIIERGALEARIEPARAASDTSGVTRLGEYWADLRQIRTITLEEILDQHGLDHIDVLKLDCEGSEFSILENTASLERIGLIVGEYHGRERFHELVARRFGGWELRILNDGDPGTFWLINPARRSVGLQPANSRVGILPARSEPPNRESADAASGFSNAARENDNAGWKPTLPSADDFWAGFQKILHPIDLPVDKSWRRYYGTLFELAGKLKPRTICEIGVRAGYSAYAFLSANPDAWMLGIDADIDERLKNSHGGQRGMWQHASTILAPFRHQLLVVDSHAIQRLPHVDLVYVDGDHTLDGCLADLRLAEASTDRILVDDYDSIPTVHAACEKFAADHPEFSRRYIDNGLTGLMLFERAAQEAVSRVDRPKRSRAPATVTIDGERVALSADYSLLFVEHADGEATPVLYHRGKRVTKSWSIELDHQQPADPWGISGGRES
ncbi:MAG: FkbM family methyltransferase [Pirellulales bacterium]